MKYLLLILFPLSLVSQSDQTFTGFFDFKWNEEKGQILLDIDNLNEEFLYVNSLAAGVGSNDIGLDRGQLGNTRIVKFQKVGNKILLIQPNLTYRAISDNQAEVKAVEEAFAQSVLWGFKIESQEANKYTIDLTPFLLRDSHDIIGRLKSRNQGAYKLDKTRAAIYLENTISFPKNTEFESMLTFTGDPKHREIRSVTPDAKSVSVRMHHSFVELPDDNYKPRTFHPYAGYGNNNYYDYATPIHEAMNKKFIRRHRLEKKDPTAAVSEAVEPIIYYIDPGCPDPVKTALMEGARWWNQAFEAAGYKDAFQVKELPEGANSLDVRYNMIQWVHRSTRGWSYGSSVSDPRTGEIIKGHVSLGSLRVRQDFMIAQGIISPYGDNDSNHGPMNDISLARLRQLSAHEVGHTIGLSHNFASSINDRASVMDYPHPVIEVENGAISYDNVYDDKIGPFDKRSILYGYQDFPEGADEEKALLNIIKETQAQGLHFLSDSDARPAGSAHPKAHLWDNGNSPIDELTRINKVRDYALNNMGINSITTGIPYSELEKILVPVYLMHRYQVDAASKLLGGVEYNYAVKGDGMNPTLTPVPALTQKQALMALLNTLSPDYLTIPKTLLEIIPPPAHGYRRDRETFGGNTGLTFDPLSAAEAAANHTLGFILHPQRLSRINQQGDEALYNYLNTIAKSVFNNNQNKGMKGQISLMVQKLMAAHLINLSIKSNDRQVASVSDYVLGEFVNKKTIRKMPVSKNLLAHEAYLSQMYAKAKAEPDSWKCHELKKCHRDLQ